MIATQAAYSTDSNVITGIDNGALRCPQEFHDCYLLLTPFLDRRLHDTFYADTVSVIPLINDVRRRNRRLLNRTNSSACRMRSHFLLFAHKTSQNVKHEAFMLSNYCENNSICYDVSTNVSLICLQTHTHTSVLQNSVFAHCTKFGILKKKKLIHIFSAMNEWTDARTGYADAMR